MRNVVLYIAMSLDGYIADMQGGVAWLEGDGSSDAQMGSYPEFIKTVDTVLMGYTTYHQIVEELSPGNWFYTGKKSYVLTHKKLPPTNEITFTDAPLQELIGHLKREAGKDIWICGGAELINQLLALDLIDKLTVTVIPTILGGGIRLFGAQDKERKLKLLSAQDYNGMVDLTYGHREDCKL